MKNLLLLEADAGGAFVEIQGPGPVDIPGIFKRMADRQGRAMPGTVYQWLQFTVLFLTLWICCEASYLPGDFLTEDCYKFALRADKVFIFCPGRRYLQIAFLNQECFFAVCICYGPDSIEIGIFADYAIELPHIQNNTKGWLEILLPWENGNIISTQYKAQVFSKGFGKILLQRTAPIVKLCDMQFIGAGTRDNLRSVNFAGKEDWADTDGQLLAYGIIGQFVFSKIHGA